MKNAIAVAAILVLVLANAAGQAKVLTNDPLTGLPLIPATVVAKDAGNEPVKMPDGQVCKSKMQGNFYSLYNYFSKQNIKLSEVIAWYSSHLSGFNKVSGYESRRSQTAFYNSDRTILIIVTGNPGAAGEDPYAYSVAYERYQPGLSEKTITSLTQGKSSATDCRVSSWAGDCAGDCFKEKQNEPESVLKEIAQAMTDKPEWKLTIAGHTDNIGGHKYDLELSQRRSAAVKKALVERYHVDASRLSTTRSGDCNPVDTNDTLEGRTRNRSVELTLD